MESLVSRYRRVEMTWSTGKERTYQVLKTGGVLFLDAVGFKESWKRKGREEESSWKSGSFDAVEKRNRFSKTCLRKGQRRVRMFDLGGRITKAVTERRSVWYLESPSTRPPRHDVPCTATRSSRDAVL